MRSEWVPDPSVESWKGLGARVLGETFYGHTDGRICHLDTRFKNGGLWFDAGDNLCSRSHEDTEPEKRTDDSFERAVDGILAELRELMLRKHRDYGPLNITLAPGGAINGLRVRMHDKLARINNLTDKQAEPENESLQDSFGDLANYGIIGLMVLRGLWPGTEGK